MVIYFITSELIDVFIIKPRLVQRSKSSSMQQVELLKTEYMPPKIYENI